MPGATIHLSGVDIVNGTPILDIKPYILEYDSPAARTISSVGNPTEHASQQCDAVADSRSATVGDDSNSSREESDDADVSHVAEGHIDGANGVEDSLGGDCLTAQAAQWLSDRESSVMTVEFTSRALRQLNNFKYENNSEYNLAFLKTTTEARKAITDILLADPRSAYRRKSCSDKLYYFTVDTMHVTCWFDEGVAEVLKVQPVSRVSLFDDADTSHKVTGHGASNFSISYSS